MNIVIMLWLLRDKLAVVVCLMQQINQLKELCTELDSQIQDLEKLLECKEQKLRDLATK